MERINRHVLAAAQFAYDNNGGMEAAIEAAIKCAKRYGLRTVPYEKINEDIGLEQFSGKPGARPKFPFWRMEIGETVKITNTHRYVVCAALRSYAKAHGKEFIFNKVPDDDLTTYVRRKK